MSHRDPHIGPSIPVEAHVADPPVLVGFGPSATSAQPRESRPARTSSSYFWWDLTRPQVVEPEVLLSEHESKWSKEGDGGDQLGPLTLPLPAKGSAGAANRTVSTMDTESPLSRDSTLYSQPSKMSTFSLGFGEATPSQRLRGTRRGSVIVKVVGKNQPAVKIPVADIATLENPNGVLECDKVQDLFSMVTGEQVTSLYYRVRCSVNGSTDTKRDAAATTMRLIVFEDGPNPFLGGMVVDAYLDGEEPGEAMLRGRSKVGSLCVVQ